MKKVYTPDEIAKGLNASKKVVYKWLSEGSLKGFKAGGMWRVTRASLEEFLKVPIPWENGGEGEK